MCQFVHGVSRQQLVLAAVHFFSHRGSHDSLNGFNGCSWPQRRRRRWSLVVQRQATGGWQTGEWTLSWRSARPTQRLAKLWPDSHASPTYLVGCSTPLQIMASKNCQCYVQQFQSKNKKKELFWPDLQASPTSFVSWLFNPKLQQGVDNGVPKQQTANAMFSKSMGKTFFEQAVLTSLGLAVQPQYSTKGIMASDNSRLIMPPCSATLVWWRPFLTRLKLFNFLNTTRSERILVFKKVKFDMTKGEAFPLAPLWTDRQHQTSPHDMALPHSHISQKELEENEENDIAKRGVTLPN